MARRQQVRHQLFLPSSMSEQLEAVAVRSGAPRSAILAAALAAYFDNQGAGEMERAFAIRLGAISSQLARIEQDGRIGIESLALFVRYMLTVHAPLAEEDEALRAIGRDRFAAFIARVGQQLAGGKRTFEPEEQA
jgi:hypothetical protein